MLFLFFWRGAAFFAGGLGGFCIATPSQIRPKSGRWQPPIGAATNAVVGLVFALV